MNWFLTLLAALLVPVIQVLAQDGVQRIHAARPQQQQVQAQYVFHNGRWWKYERGQWYYQVLPEEKLACQQLSPLNIR